MLSAEKCQKCEKVCAKKCKNVQKFTKFEREKIECMFEHYIKGWEMELSLIETSINEEWNQPKIEELNNKIGFYRNLKNKILEGEQNERN